MKDSTGLLVLSGLAVAGAALWLRAKPAPTEPVPPLLPTPPPSAPPTAAPPDLVVYGVTATPSVVSVGDEVSLFVGVQNRGGTEGGRDVLLRIAGAEAVLNTGNVLPGNDVTLLFKVRIDIAGEHEYSVEQFRGTISVVAPITGPVITRIDSIPDIGVLTVPVNKIQDVILRERIGTKIRQELEPFVKRNYPPAVVDLAAFQTITEGNLSVKLYSTRDHPIKVNRYTKAGVKALAYTSWSLGGAPVKRLSANTPVTGMRVDIQPGNTFKVSDGDVLTRWQPSVAALASGTYQAKAVLTRKSLVQTEDYMFLEYDADSAGQELGLVSVVES